MKVAICPIRQGSSKFSDSSISRRQVGFRAMMGSFWPWLRKPIGVGLCGFVRAYLDYFYGCAASAGSIWMGV